MTPQQRKAAIDAHIVQAMTDHNIQFAGDFSDTFLALFNLGSQQARGRMSQVMDTFQTYINGDHALRFPPLPFDWPQHLRVINPYQSKVDSYLNNSVSTLTYDTNRVLFPGQPGV